MAKAPEWGFFRASKALSGAGTSVTVILAILYALSRGYGHR